MAAAVALLIVHVSVFSAAVWLGLNRPAVSNPLSLEDLTWAAALMIPFPMVGALLALRHPRNPLGWLFLVGPLLVAVGTMLDEVSIGQGREVMGWIPYLADAFFIAGIGLVAGFFLLLFPDGQPVSRFFRRAAWLGAIGILLLVAIGFTQPCLPRVLDQAFEGHPTCTTASPMVRVIDNPFGLGAVLGSGLRGTIGAVGGALIIGSLLAGAWSMAVRYRRGGPVDQAQLRWPLGVVVVTVPAFVLVSFAESVVPSSAILVVWCAAMIGLPVAIGIAITRYRLFEIDRIITKAVVYVAVVSILGAVYAVASLLSTSLILGKGGSAPSWVVALSTLVVFALFSPLRRRVQRGVDRRFNRFRYDATRIVESFSAHVGDSSIAEEIVSGVGATVSAALRPSRVTVWLRQP